VKKNDLIVIRINKQGDLVSSRPCYNCLEMMKAVNIKKVYYSDNDGNIICENVKDMISIHASIMTKVIYSLQSKTKIDKDSYFENLLKALFPSSIKKINLDNFLKYNLTNVLPECTSIIENNNGIYIVSILNKSKTIVTSRLII
jgi:hypothetical protein